MSPIDPLNLSIALISFPTITPRDEGIMQYLSDVLEKFNFNCHILDFGDEEVKVKNLYAKLGDGSPNLCFAGHVDVVDPGNKNNWKFDPFSPQVQDGILYGRGSSDMKTGVAAFISAVSEFVDENIDFKGCISLILTGDEEGKYSRYGTKSVLSWLKENGENIDYCIVGEPTSQKEVGDQIKNGRRGSITFTLKCNGVQGHVAYPEQANNPINKMVSILYNLTNTILDTGNAYFDRSNCEIITIDVGNKSTNVIPESIVSKFNIRFNNEHTPESLFRQVKNICNAYSENQQNTKHTDFSITDDGDYCYIGDNYKLTANVGGEVFITKEHTYTDLLVHCIKKTVGVTPRLSTSGGTSDARYIFKMYPVVDFGLVGNTAHKVDESVSVKDIYNLTKIYKKFIEEFFSINDE